MHHWHWLIVIYLFLGGLGAGAYLTSFAAEKGWLGSNSHLKRVGYLIAAPIVAIGTILLVFDLGQGLHKPYDLGCVYTFRLHHSWTSKRLLSIEKPIGSDSYHLAGGFFGYSDLCLYRTFSSCNKGCAHLELIFNAFIIYYLSDFYRTICDNNPCPFYRERG